MFILQRKFGTTILIDFERQDRSSVKNGKDPDSWLRNGYKLS